MRWGLDAAYPPDADTAWRQFADGYSFFCGYIGGKAEHVWTLEDWHRIEAVGFSLLPIWVAPLVDDAGHDQGVEDGNRALVTLQSLGFSGVVALDVENGLRPRQYARGFSDAIVAGDCAPVLYGSPATIEAIGDLPWSAWWLCALAGVHVRYKPAPPDWSMWQFSFGDQVDFNVAVDDFTFALLQSPEAPSASPRGEA